MSNNHLGLSDEEYPKIAKAIKLFYKQEISKVQHIKIINSTSANYISTMLINFNSYKRLTGIERIRNNLYRAAEVQGFVISINGKKEHLIYDRRIIEFLANNGDKEEQEK